MHQAEHDKIVKPLQRKVGFGPIKVLGHVGHHQNPQGRLSHTFIVPRVSQPLPLFGEKKTTRRRAYGCQVSVSKRALKKKKYR